MSNLRTPEEELARRQTMDDILEKANKLFAVKLVEKIVFGLVAMILAAFAAVLINGVIRAQNAPNSPLITEPTR